MCCVCFVFFFRANVCVCVCVPEGIVENITLNSAMGKRMTISPCFTMCLQFREEKNEPKGAFNILRNVTKRLWNKKEIK